MAWRSITHCMPPLIPIASSSSRKPPAIARYNAIRYSIRSRRDESRSRSSFLLISERLEHIDKVRSTIEVLRSKLSVCIASKFKLADKVLDPHHLMSFPTIMRPSTSRNEASTTSPYWARRCRRIATCRSISASLRPPSRSGATTCPMSDAIQASNKPDGLGADDVNAAPRRKVGYWSLHRCGNGGIS